MPPRPSAAEREFLFSDSLFPPTWQLLLPFAGNLMPLATDGTGKKSELSWAASPFVLRLLFSDSLPHTRLS